LISLVFNGLQAQAADPSHNTGMPLAFDQALHLAQDRSRQLAAQDSATAAARQMALAASQRPDPVLKFGINNLPVDGRDRFSLTRDFMTMQSVGVMQEFTREDKRVARASRLEREAEAGEAGRAMALATLQRDTAVAWLDRYYQERMLALLQSQRDEARLQVEAAEAGYRGGRGSQADVFVARAALAQMEDRIAQAELQVATARTTLSRWVGEAANRPLGAEPGTGNVPLHHTNLADLTNQLAGHPEIVLMSKQEEMAQADAEIARANKQADWSAEFMVSHRPSYSNMVSFNVSVPLQWDQHDRQDRDLAAKLAIADQMRAQREEATREHLAQTQTTLQAWQSGRERLARYDSTLIPLAAERTQATLAAYRGGTAPLNAVLEARRMDIDTRMERLRLEMETARLWAQLNFLIPADHDLAASRP
jgi:outer membrane protein TolC